MQNLGHLLTKKFKVAVNYYGAFELILSEWPNLVGDLANFLVPKSIYKNDLIIACDNSAWLSEVDYFKDNIIEKCNTMLNIKKNRVRIKGVKVKLEANLINLTVKKKVDVPEFFDQKIKWNIEKKQKAGYKLCVKCQNIWDKNSICRICYLTS